MSLLESASGRPVDVNSDNQLLVEAMTIPIGFKRCYEDSELWTFPIASTTPTTTNSQFFHLKNTSTTRSMAVVYIFLTRASTTETISLYAASGTSTSPTAITPINWNIGTTKIPSATIERGAALALTLLTAAITTLLISTTGTAFTAVNNNTPLVISPGGQMVLAAGTGTVAITGHVIAHMV